MTYELGIDLGGTKILAGVVDVGTGKILSHEKKRTRAKHTAGDIVDRLILAAKGAIDESGVNPHEIERVGIGVAGQIDRENGIVINGPNLAHMQNMPLAEKVSAALGKPVYLYNDVEAAAAGEAAFGAAKGQPDFVVIFVGTGIGGAIYHDGDPYTGATATAGEIGHTTVDENGRICSCGGLGHLEAYASRTAIVRYILAQMKAGRQSVLRDVADEIDPDDPGGSGIRSSALSKALEDGDALTKEALALGADYLAAGLSSVVNFYNPPLIILGGGLVGAIDWFFERVSMRTREKSLMVPRQSLRIEKAALEDFSGIVGAAVLAARAG